MNNDTLTLGDKEKARVEAAYRAWHEWETTAPTDVDLLTAAVERTDRDATCGRRRVLGITDPVRHWLMPDWTATPNKAEALAAWMDHFAAQDKEVQP